MKPLVGGQAKRTIPLTPEEIEYRSIQKELKRSHEWRNNVLTASVAGFGFFLCFLCWMSLVISGYFQARDREAADLERYRITHSPYPPPRPISKTTIVP